MTSPFDTPDAPSSGDRFVVADHVGSLCIVTVKGHEVGVETSSGVGDVIVADILVVDGPDTGGHYSDAWIFGKVLVGQMKRKIGRTLLGRFGQGEKQPGKTPAWVLNPTDDPREIALAQRAQAASMRPDPPLEGHNGGQQRAADPWDSRSMARPPADEPPF
jgi:hypothetical protein